MRDVDLKENNDELKKTLMKLFSIDQIENLFLYISNPARYPQIIDWIKRYKSIIAENLDTKVITYDFLFIE